MSDCNSLPRSSCAKRRSQTLHHRSLSLPNWDTIRVVADLFFVNDDMTCIPETNLTRIWPRWARFFAAREFVIELPFSSSSPASAPFALFPLPSSSPSCPPNPQITKMVIILNIIPFFWSFFADSATGTAAQSRSPSPSAQDTLTLRALVSTKDAGVIIGKAGKNVADLREQTGVKAGVSKVIPGVHERVLTVTGSVDAVSKVSYLFSHSKVLFTYFYQAYNLIIAQLVAAAPSSPITHSSPSTHTSIRLLISHNLMGTIIGRSGLKIKAIQDGSGARMIASKEMLPQSTERIVEVQGTPEAIGHAVEEIGKCLLEDWERGLGTVLYHPAPTDTRRGHSYSSSYSSSSRKNGDGAGRRSPPSSPNAHSPVSSTPPANLRTQNISIPSDMVGCIIGRNGTKITEIRRLSGSKISIAKTPHDETGERMFTIVGTPEANEKALFLLYNQLESEKERRVGREAQQQAEMQE